MKIDALDVLDEAKSLIMKRAAIRDTTSERSMKKTVKAFNVLYGTNLTETQGWQFMSILKKARATQGDYHKDDYLDDTAYSALACESEHNSHQFPKNNILQLELPLGDRIVPRS